MKVWPALCALGLVSRVAFADAPEEPRPRRTKGDLVQTDTLGMSMVSYNLDTGKTTDVGDVAGLSEFVGLHYYFLDHLRIGMNFQFTEYLTTPMPGQSRFATFALLPQIGWHFWGPLFAALVFGIEPWTLGGANGSNNFDLAVQGVFGAAFPVAKGVAVTVAGEVPYNFLVHRTIGFTPLLGVSIRAWP